MPPKVGRVASDGKRVFEPSHNDSPLGQNMGEPWADGPPAYIMDDSHVSRRFPTWYLKIGRGFTQFTTRRQERQSERRASNLFTTFLTSPPDLERFFQKFPPFSAKLVSPSVNLPHMSSTTTNTQVQKSSNSVIMSWSSVSFDTTWLMARFGESTCYHGTIRARQPTRRVQNLIGATTAEREAGVSSTRTR